MDKNAKIYVAGHRGMVGSAIVRELERQGYTNIITRTHSELDLYRQAILWHSLLVLFPDWTVQTYQHLEMQKQIVKLLRLVGVFSLEFRR